MASERRAWIEHAHTAITIGLEHTGVGPESPPVYLVPTGAEAVPVKLADGFERSQLLNLESNALAKWCSTRAYGLRERHRASRVERLSRELSSSLEQLGGESYHGLIPVVAHCATSTYQPEADSQEEKVGHFSHLYSLWLLALWIWDDMHDVSKAHAGTDFVPQSIALVKAEFSNSGLRHGEGLVRRSHLEGPVELRQQLNDCCHLLNQVRAELLQCFSSSELEPLFSETHQFFDSFATKVTMTQKSMDLVDDYERNRALSCGILPCYEMEILFKAYERNIPLSTVRGYIHQHPRECRAGALISSLHCAAVNDLFSVYKDRTIEDTENFPSVFAPGKTVTDYFEGAVATVEYVRDRYRDFLAQCKSLPAGQVRDLLVEVWDTNMEGNLGFHYCVSRYREGATVLNALVDDQQSADAKAAVFSSVVDSPRPLPV
ncbi:MAG: terpene synthase family protein [Myxococcota bacterium]